MRAIKLIIPVIIVICSGAYGALWYLSCRGVESRIPQGDFEIAFGDSFLTVKGSTQITGITYGGLFSGRAAVGFSLQRMEATYTAKNLPAEFKSPKVSWDAKESPLPFEISGPIFGSSVALKIPALDHHEHVQEMMGMPAQHIFTTNSEVVYTLQLLGSKFLLQRAGLSKEIVTNPSKLLDETSGIIISPMHGNVAYETKDNLMMSFASGPSSISYGRSEGGGIRADFDLDLNAEYGEAFYKQFNASMEAAAANANRGNVPPELAAVQKTMQQIMMGLDLKFLIKGGAHVVLPTKLPSFNQGGPSEVGPLTVSFDHFKLRMPFFLGAERELNGYVHWRREGASPLKVLFNQATSASPLHDQIARITKVFQDDPTMKSLNIDFSRNTPSSLNSISELEGSQGAYVMILGALSAYDDLVLSAPGTFNLKLDVTTGSGGVAPLDFLAAKVDAAIKWKMAKEVELGVAAVASGPTQFEGTFTIAQPRYLVETLFSGMRVFTARSLLATFFNPPSSSGAPDEKEKGLLKFIFSDSLIHELSDSALRLVQKIDSSPETPDLIEVKLAGGMQGVTINGGSTTQLLQSLEGDAKKELAHLQEVFGDGLKEVDPELAEKIRSTPIPL